MKSYTKPEINITVLNNEDVLMVSGGVNTTKFTSSKTYSSINF